MARGRRERQQPQRDEAAIHEHPPRTETGLNNVVEGNAVRIPSDTPGLLSDVVAVTTSTSSLSLSPHVVHRVMPVASTRRLPHGDGASTVTGQRRGRPPHVSAAIHVGSGGDDDDDSMAGLHSAPLGYDGGRTPHSPQRRESGTTQEPGSADGMSRRSWSGDLRALAAAAAAGGPLPPRHLHLHHRRVQPRAFHSTSWLLRLRHRRSGVYDELGDAPNTGLRVWYDDYTTIDWIHDHIKESIRLRSRRRNVTTVFNRIAKHMDDAQAWIVLTLIGIAAGVVASLIDIAYTWLNDLKYGYCARAVWLRHAQCCRQNGDPLFAVNGSKCVDWVAWPDIVGVSSSDNPAAADTVALVVYVVTGTVFAAISAQFVMWSATTPVDTDTIVRDAQDAAAAGSALARLQRRRRLRREWTGDWQDPARLAASRRQGTVVNNNMNTTQPVNGIQFGFHHNDFGAGVDPAWRSSHSTRIESLMNLASRPVRKVLFPAGGSGVPEVKTILGGFVIRGFLGMRTLVTKTIGLVFSISSGLVVGMQGPLVHISCAIGNVMTRLFIKYTKNEAKRREIMSAACAAGVSVAFGAPIGGVLFSLEEMSYYFPLKTMWRSFYCAMVAAVMLKFMNPLGTGKLVMFQVTYDRPWRAVELIPFLILGVFGGVVGSLFIRLTTLLAKARSVTVIPRYPVMEVIVIAGITGVLNYAMPLTRGGNGELVAALFSECNVNDGVLRDDHVLCRSSEMVTTMLRLCVTMVSKFVLMVITFGIRVPAGIFVPSMVVGASAGRCMGVLVQYLYHRYPSSGVFTFCGTESPDTCVIPGVYAMVGAAAALSGSTRMTVSLTVIMFELTGSLTYVLPLMVSIMVAKWVGDALGRDSIYDVVIGRSGYPYLNHKHALISVSGCARDVMVSDGDVVIVDRVYRVGEIEAKLDTLVRQHGTKDSGLPVVKENGILVGFISHTELEHVLAIVRSKVTGQDYRDDEDDDVHDDDDEETGLLDHGDGSRRPMRSSPDQDVASAGCEPSVVVRGAGSLDSAQDDRTTPSENSDSGGNGDNGQSCLPPVNISQWVDQTPLLVAEQAPIDFVVEMFIKLGARTVCVVREGIYVGVIHKKRLLVFLSARDHANES